MVSYFDRLKNREAFAVDIKGGKVWLREPTFDDADRVAAMSSPQLQNGLSLSLCLVNEDGSRAYEKQPDEDDTAFAERVLKEAKQHLGRSDMIAIMSAMQKLLEPQQPEELAKN